MPGLPSALLPYGGPYSRLAPLVREYIHEQKWRELRDIQEEAAGAILDGEGHILIAAGTASGKTEAAFFPVISAILAGTEKTAGAEALYVSPLKALINDQAERLGELCRRGGIPLWRWHGDAPGAGKRRFTEKPSGILQITPESLEALLLRYPGKTAALFQSLRFVIIDEVHAFMGSLRGAQLLCLLARIEEDAGCRPRRIGLSATLGDYREAMAWLTGGSGPGGSGDSDPGGPGNGVCNGVCRLIRERKAKRRFRLALDYFSPEGVRGEDPEAAYYQALYAQCRPVRSGKCVIFTNSRLEAEETVAALRDLARRRREADVFYVHHGSVSGSLRAEAERDLKEREGPVVTAATATLELGIDIGRLDRIVQIGAPPSAAAFVQRLGRSGRRGKAAEMYFTSLEPPREREDILDAIPWTLLKTVAVIQLYLEEGWIETGAAPPYPAGLLCHETLAILASRGETEGGDLARRVLSLPVCGSFPREDYRELLAGLIRGGYIEKTREGGLIIGLEGERLTAHHSFYALFPGEREFRVLHGGRELGTVNFLPPRGTGLALGGRYWRVENFDVPRREIFVAPGQTGGEKVWRGAGAETHPRIAGRMRRALTGDSPYPYLSERARTRLERARRDAETLGIAAGPFLADPAGQDRGNFFILPWLGSRGMRTLLAVLQNEDHREDLGIRGLYRKNDFALSLSSRLSLPDFKEKLKALLADLCPPSPAEALEALLDPAQLPYVNKYDHLLPPRLLVKQYSANMLDPGELNLFRI
jgi:ATP-dependent Lhr-like helicase